ncbi:hypothetical protein [Paractinoplanes toevensis]|uniref:hypothetical protein n=1 Tax=Paractinoplanes toevensis TaxID=571911 RepID=UPI003F693387
MRRLVTQSSPHQRNRLLAEGPPSTGLFITEFPQDPHAQFPKRDVTVTHERDSTVEDLPRRSPMQGGKSRHRNFAVVVLDLPPRQPHQHRKRQLLRTGQIKSLTRSSLPIPPVTMDRIASTAAQPSAGPTEAGVPGVRDLLHLRYSTLQEAELVAFRVSENMPWLRAGLADVGYPSTSRQQSLQFLRLVPIGGVDIDVQTQLAGLGLVSAVEDDRGLRAAETNPGRTDLYILAVTLQFDIAQYLAPEPRQQLRIMCVQDQFGDASGHPLTISAHAARRSLRLRAARPHLVAIHEAEMLGIVWPVSHRAVVAMLGLVVRPVPLVGPAVARGLARDTQINEYLRKIPP